MGRRANPDAAKWPDCRGALAGLIRTRSWRLSPLGPIENWPQSLKTAVELMLQSRQPAYVAWGRALITLYNDAAIPLFDHPEALGKPYSEICRDSWGDVRPVVEATLAGEPQHVAGQRVRRADQSEPSSWYTFSWTPLRDEKGDVAGFYCVATETTLQIVDEQLRTILQNTRDGVNMLDLQSGKYVYMSPAHVALTGFSAEELHNFSAAESLRRVHPDDQEIAERQLKRLSDGTETESTVEYRWRVKSGEYRWFSISRKLVRDPGGAPATLVGVSRDITPQKEAEDALRLSQARLALATESADIGTWEWDLKTNHVVRTAKVYALLGIPPLEESDDAENFWRRVHPEDLRVVKQGLETVFESGRDWRAEFRVLRADGALRWLVGVGRLYRDPDGAPRAMHGVNYDITDQKEAEAALRESEKRYRLLHETQRDGFVRVAMDGRVLEVNEIFCQMLGYTADELLGRTYLELTPKRWHGFEADIVEKQILQRGYSEVYEKEYQRKDGSVLPVELRTILSRDDSGKPESMWAIVRDITERKNNEARLHSLKDELVHVGRISELSQVSAGIAHELNQPLAAMLNYAATAKRMIAKKDKTSLELAQSAIEKAGVQAERAGEIIRRMRDFVERHETNRREDRINVIVEEAIALGLIGAQANGIVTHFDLSENLPPVMADRIQIQQVLVNLLRNAVDAMSQSPKRELTIATKMRNTNIEVAVADTGIGIPENVTSRLFQPFVTTKPGGMGIGLAISRSIIEAHGGVIAVEANPGGGTVFRFSLPAAP